METSVNLQTSNQSAVNAHSIERTIQNTTQKTLESYRIDWDGLAPDVLIALQNHKTEPCSKRIMRRVNQHVIGELRTINNKQRVKKCVLLNVAKQIVAKYADVFMDRLENGRPIGNGTYTTYRKLKDKNKNDHRADERDSLNKALKISIKKLRFVDYVKLGCIQWQPDNYPENDTEETLEQKRIALSKYPESLGDPDFDASLKQLVEDTYCIQRLFLNQMDPQPTLKSIKQQWPILRDPMMILHHFGKLTGTDLQELFIQFEKSISMILSYADSVNETSLEKSAPNYDKFKCALTFISKKFNEDINNVFWVFQVKIQT